RRLAEFAAGTSLARWYKFDLAVQLTWQWQTLVAVSVMTPAKIGDYYKSFTGLDCIAKVVYFSSTREWRNW
ncbi:MAG: hypothetical protein KKA54_05950, partial [Proteobacteria bacterium]|nr:hypothetical protein [Pseudomonadota bacterium]